MNKRIHELAYESGLPTYNPEGMPTKLEKFAELLVQEFESYIKESEGDIDYIQFLIDKNLK